MSIMKTMFFIQTHSDFHTYPINQIKKNLFLHKELIKDNGCDFFVFQEGLDHLPDSTTINYFEYTSIQPDKINFCITGIHEPRKNFLRENGWIVSIQPGSIKAMIKAMEVCIKNNYDKAVYFDHDVQFFTDNIKKEFFGLNKGSGSNKSKHYGFNETAFFTINKEYFEIFHEAFLNLSKKSDSEIVENNWIMENILNISHTFSFKGDRFGDWGLPETFDLSYDYVSQLPHWIYYKKDNGFWKKTMITTELDDIWF